MLKPFPRAGGSVEREDGYLPLEAYAALGEGRAIALSGADGSIDWWCCPNLDSLPLFDRLLNPDGGGYFAVTPEEPFTAEIGYRDGSNVHEAVFTTASGKARQTESLNSGPAGRLPWSELARRVDGIEGSVRFRIELVFGTRGDTAGPFLSSNASGSAFHVTEVMGLFRYVEDVIVHAEGDRAIRASLVVKEGRSSTVAVIAGEHEPLVVAPVADIDRRIEVSCKAWREWTERLGYAGR